MPMMCHLDVCMLGTVEGVVDWWTRSLNGLYTVKLIPLFVGRGTKLSCDVVDSAQQEQTSTSTTSTSSLLQKSLTRLLSALQFRLDLAVSDPCLLPAYWAMF
jgi:hypothetical protein